MRDYVIVDDIRGLGNFEVIKKADFNENRHIFVDDSDSEYKAHIKMREYQIRAKGASTFLQKA